NQQHENNGAAEEEKGVALVTDDIFVQGPADRKMSFCVVLGIRLRPVLTERLQLGIGLLDADALAQTRDGEHPMAPSIVRRIFHSQRRPHSYTIVTKPEALRHHADDFAWRIVESDRRADRAGSIL